MNSLRPAVHNNIPVINCLRGIAATMVCFFHFVNMTKGYVETKAITDLFYFGKTGVHVFFVISGVVIPLSMIRAGYTFGNWGKFMLKRLARLEPPYLASLILAILYFKVRTLVATSSDVDMMPPARDLLLHIGYLIPFFDGDWALDVYWTLSVEFQYYLILSILFPFVMQGKAAARYCFYALFLISPFFFGNEGFFPQNAPLFLMGIVYVLLLSGYAGSIETLVVVALCLIVGVLNLPVSYIVAGFITLLIIHYIPYYTNKVLFFLGEISYSLYLLHLITGAAMINLLSHKFKLAYQKPFVIIGGYLLSVACSYVFYRIIEKPSQKLSSKIRYKSRDLQSAPAVELLKNR